jgi:ribosomal protein S18 acetylase RimI-like enzyme
MAKQELIVIPAEPDDAETIFRLLFEAGAWLQSRGIRQWSAVWPLSAYEQAETRGRIARGWCYLARRDNIVVGTLTVQPSDEALWGADQGDALYVHGLAISRAVAGQGVGLALLRWAEREVIAHGRRCLRLDCMAGNPGLRAYYQRAGFVERGIIVEGDGWEAALFEKDLRLKKG